MAQRTASPGATRRARRGPGFQAFWRNEAGLTLAEMLLTLAILGIVASAFLFFQSAGVRYFTLDRQQADLEQNLQFGLDTVTRELRQATRVTAWSFPNHVDYQDRNGQSASFYLDAAAGELRQRVVGDATPERVIATGITAVTFVELPGPSPLVLVSLTGQQGDRSRTEGRAVTVRAVRAP